MRLIPQTGWLAWNAASGQLLVWTGSAWTGLDVAMGLLTRAPSARVAAGAAGSAADMVAAEELLSGLSGASVTSTIAIPNRAIVLGVSARSVTAITGATSYNCGISGETSKFGGSLAPEPQRQRESLTESRTMKDGGAAGVATIGAGGVEVVQQALADTQSTLQPLVPDLDTLRWLFIAVALIGFSVTIYARWDDWRKGRR